MFCRKCGQQVEEGALHCTNCGAEIQPSVQTQPEQEEEQKLAAAVQTVGTKVRALGKKKIVLMIAAVVVVIVAIVLIVCGIQNSRCQYSGCTEDKKYGDYCIEHVCLYGSCTSARSYGSDYCYYHKTLSAATAADPEDDLRFSNIEIEHNSSYTVVTGKVTNTGSTTYTFVKIKGAFKTSSGSTVDTDWTYAVGSEGLAPGESATFRMSVPKDRTITKCTISIIDYDT